MDAAILAECNAEGTPAYEAARAKAQSLDQEFEMLCRGVWERPLEKCDRDDLAMRCEAALVYFALNGDGTFVA